MEMHRFFSLAFFGLRFSLRVAACVSVSIVVWLCVSPEGGAGAGAAWGDMKTPHLRGRVRASEVWGLRMV